MAADDVNAEMDELDREDAQDQQDDQDEQRGITPGVTPAAFQRTAPGVYSPTPALPPPGAAPRTGITPRTYFNPATVDPNASQVDPGTLKFYKPDQPPPEASGSGWEDAVEAAWQGTLSLGKSLTGVVDFTNQQLGANPTVQSYIDATKESITERTMHSVERMTPASQKALTASAMALFGSDKDAEGNHIPSPGEVGYLRYFGLNAIQMLPTVVISLLPGGLASRLGLWAMKTLGFATTELAEGAAGAAGKMVLTETAEKLAERFGMGGTGAAFGALNAGEVFNKAKEELQHAPLAEMQESPAYNELIKGGMSDIQARGELLKRVAPSLVAKAFALGAAAGTGIVSIGTGRVLGTAGRGLLTRMAIGAGEGGAVLGAQGAGNATIEQQAQQAMGTRGSLDIAPIIAEGVAWGLPGLAFGAAGAGVGKHGGVIRKDLPAPTPVSPQGSEIDVAARAALGAALGGGAEGAARGRTPHEAITSTSPEMPSGAPPGTQGELLHPSQVGPTVTPAAPAAEPVPERTQAPPATAPIQAPGERTPGYQAPQPPSPALDEQGRPVIAQPAQEIGFGMPGATQPEAVPPGGAARPPPTPEEQYQQQMGRAPAATQAAVQTSQAAPNMAVPPLAEQAVQTSRAKAPTGPAISPESLAMSRQQLVDELKTTPGVDPKSLTGQSQKQLAAMRDRLVGSTASPDVSTVVKGGPAPARSEAPGPAAEGRSAPQVPGALTPPAPEGVRGPIKAPVEARPTTEPKAKISTGVRPEGGAPPATDERPAGATAEEKPPITELAGAKGAEEEEDPRDTAIGHLATAKQLVLAEARARKTPVTKGSVAEKAINDAMAEMQRAFTDQKQDPGDMMNMLIADAQRGTPNAGENVATYMARRNLVAGMMKSKGEEFKLRPLALKRVADTRSEVEQDISEAQQQVVAKPRKLSTSEAVDESATGAGEGGETAGLEPVHEAVPKGTSKVVATKTLVRQILDPQHPMDVATAEKMLAKTSNLGRPITKGFGSLHDGLETEWNRLHGVDGQAEKAKLDAELARLDRQQPMTREGTQARTLETDMRDRKIAEVRKKLADWAPERIIALAKALTETSDQVKAVTARANLEARVKEGEPPADIQPKRAGINPRSSKYVLSSTNDRRIDAGFTEKFTNSGVDRPHYTTHEFLNDIVQNPLINSELPPFRMMATQLRKLVDNVPMMTPDQALREGRITQARYDKVTDEREGITAGTYEPDAKIILINPTESRGAGTIVNTGIHEIVHAIGRDYIERLLNFDPNHPDLLALQAISHELEQHFIAASKNGELSPREAQRIGYALKNLHELHAMVMTDPVVHGFAASRVASSQLTGRLARYGFGPRAGRSIWDNVVNWTRKILGMDAPKSASEYTMFDHIMRPAGEIAEHAADYNKRNTLPKDATLRAAAEPLYDQIGDAVRNAAEFGRRELPHLPSAAIDYSRPATLQITNTDQLVTRYLKTFEPGKDLVMPAGNPLERVRDAREKIAYRTKQMFDHFTDKAQALTTDAKSLDQPTQDAVSKLLNDVTIANVHVGKDLTAYQKDVNAKRPEAAAEMQRRFDALSPNAQAIEQRFVKIHAELDAREFQAKVEGALARVFPDTNEAQREAWGKTTSTRKRLEDFLANPDTSELAKSYGDAWADKYADLAKITAKTLYDGWQEGDFVPLRRYGDYAIAYGEKGTPSEGLERFETRGEAEERHAQLRREQTPNLRQIDFTEKDALANTMRDSGYTERLNAALNKRPDLAEHADDIRDLMNKLWLENMSRSDGSRMKRRGIQGASLDFTRTLNKEVNDTAVRTGYFAHGGERMTALADMKRVVDDLAAHGKAGEAREARQVYVEMAKRVVGQEDPGGAFAAITRRAGTFGYMQSLASLSHLATATIEAYSMALPQIGARHGMGATTLEFARVGKSLLGPMLKTGGGNFMKALGNKLKEKDWNVADTMAAHLKDAGFNAGHVDAVFNMLKRTGLIDHSFARELKRLANPEGLLSATGRVVDYFNNLMGVWSHSVDATNRANVAMSSFNLEFRRTGDLAKALKYSEERARSAMPNYNLANKSRISTSAGMLGGMAGPMTQFKQYGFHAYGILANAVKASFAKLPSEQRNEARYALAGMLATHALTAGTFTLIADPLRYIMGLYDWMTGAAKPHDYQADLRGYLSHAVGPTAAEFISRGAINTFLGGSVYRRVGFANMFEMPPIESFDTAGYLKAIGTAFAGASGEDAIKFSQGMQAFGQGDWGAGFKAMVPRPIRDAMSAYELATKGVTTQRGRTLLPASKITPYDVGLQALGFQPSRVNEAREGSAAIEQRRDEAKAGHDKLVQQYTAKPDKRADTMTKVRAFNLDPNNASAKIDMKQLNNAVKQQTKRAQQPGAFGLRLPKKGAQQLMEAGSFANVQ